MRGNPSKAAPAVHLINGLMRLNGVAEWLTVRLNTLLRRIIEAGGGTKKPRPNARNPTEFEQLLQQLDLLDQISGLLTAITAAAESAPQDPLGVLREKFIPSFHPQGDGSRVTQTLWGLYRGRDYRFVFEKLLSEHLPPLLNLGGVREEPEATRALEEIDLLRAELAD